MVVSLLVLPGDGQRDVTLPAGATLQDLATREGVTGRQLTLNGRTVVPTEWPITRLSSGDEVGALLQSIKGA